MVTRALKVTAGAVVVVVASMFAPAEAGASTQAVTVAPTCQFGSSYGIRVVSAEVVTPSKVSVGEVQLCRDSSYNYWGFLLLRSPATASEYGDVTLERDRSGSGGGVDLVNCKSPGGNDYVLPGQTRCWTPKLSGLSGAYTFGATGTLISSHTGNFVAYGATFVTR